MVSVSKTWAKVYVVSNKVDSALNTSVLNPTNPLPSAGPNALVLASSLTHPNSVNPVPTVGVNDSL